MPTDTYWLGGHYLSGARLHLQHELTKTNFNENLLDLAIDCHEKHDLVIADVACGTGAWLLELANRLPATCTFEGLDIDLSETPPKAWLPKNVSFHNFDIKQEPDKQLWQRYDIVHVQYLMTFVSDDEVELVLRRFMKLLKPGGHIQWTDADSTGWRFPRGHDRSMECPEARNLYEFALHEIVPRKPSTWVRHLKSTFERTGLDDVKSHVPEAKVSTLKPMMLNWLWAVEETFIVLRDKVPEKRDLIEEWFSRRDQLLIIMKKESVGFDMRMTTCVGRLPIAGTQ